MKSCVKGRKAGTQVSGDGPKIGPLENVLHASGAGGGTGKKRSVLLAQTGIGRALEQKVQLILNPSLVTAQARGPGCGGVACGHATLEMVVARAEFNHPALLVRRHIVVGRQAVSELVKPAGKRVQGSVINMMRG